MSKAAKSKRFALSGAGMLALVLIVAGLWLVGDSPTTVPSIDPERLRFRTIAPRLEQHKRLMLVIHRVTIAQDSAAQMTGFGPALHLRFDFRRYSANGEVHTSSHTVSADERMGPMMEVNLPTAALADLEPRALFYAVDSKVALGVDVHAANEHWDSGNTCPGTAARQHYFTAAERWGVGTHQLHHRCKIDGRTIEYAVDYTIQEWKPRLAIREVWLGAGSNSGLCYQAINQGTAPSWYYRVNVHLDALSNERPIVSSPPLHPLQAGQVIAGCVALPRLEQHQRDALRVELEPLYDGRRTGEPYDGG